MSYVAGESARSSSVANVLLVLFLFVLLACLLSAVRFKTASLYASNCPDIIFPSGRLKIAQISATLVGPPAQHYIELFCPYPGKAHQALSMRPSQG